VFQNRYFTGRVSSEEFEPDVQTW